MDNLSSDRPLPNEDLEHVDEPVQPERGVNQGVNYDRPDAIAHGPTHVTSRNTSHIDDPTSALEGDKPVDRPAETRPGDKDPGVEGSE